MPVTKGYNVRTRRSVAPSPSSAPSPLRSSPPRPEPSTTSVEELSSGDDDPEDMDDEDDDSLVGRVRTAIAYTRAQLRKAASLCKPHASRSLFSTHTPPPSTSSALPTPHKSPP
jgi:hypothetical protein